MSGETCNGCGVDLSTRPVMRMVRNPHGIPPRIQKRVHMKPVQVVVALRVEGSAGAVEAAQDQIEGLVKLVSTARGWSIRLCMPCVEKAGGLSASLAVVLDKKQEQGE